MFGDVIQLQGVSGDVTVTTERPPYRVEAFSVAAAALPPAQARQQPSRLLLARHQVVPFTGRDRELADLDDWMGSGEAMSVRLIHAAGGQGKTRLAGHVARQCEAAGWTVWRALHNPAPAVTNRIELPVACGALVVVDYADRWPPSHLLALLTHLHSLNLRAGIVLRVLLLARSAGFWWPALADRLYGDLLVEADARALPPLGDGIDRNELFHSAQRHFAVAMRTDAAADLSAPAALDGPGYGQVLAVHMAALVAVDAHRLGAAPPVEPHAVSEYLLRREHAYWQALYTRVENAVKTSPPVMRRTVYVATLAGALPRAEAHIALSRTSLASTVETADQIIDDHRTCYPPEDPRTVLEALHPGRLGEDLVGLSTPGHRHSAGDAGWLVDDWATTAAQALLTNDDGETAEWAPAAVTVLVETARRWPHVATEVLYPLIRQRPDLALAAGGATLTRLAELPRIDPAVLEAVEAVLPEDRHVDFDVAAAAITGALTEYRLAATTDPYEHARLYITHARRLANAGRYREALVSAEEAVAIHRRLVSANPTYLPDLAGALKNLGTLLSRWGRREEAIVPAEEAAEIYGQLAAADPDAYLPDLAMSLNNLGAFLSQWGRREEAIEPAEQAADIYRQLAEAEPGAYLPYLAGALNNLGNVLSEFGRPEEALTLTREAADIYRQLADIDPDVYLPDLASALINLGNGLSELGRHQEALAPTREATDIIRRLAEANPDVYLSYLAASLNNLGVGLSELDRHQEALAPTEEAVAIRRRLAEVDPDAFLNTLAGSLNNLAVRLTALGRWEEALVLAEEAVSRSRNLLGADRTAHLPTLAMSLSGYASACAEGGLKLSEGLAAVQEAIAIYQSLVEQFPDVFKEDLWSAYHTLADLLESLGRADEAADVRSQLALWTD